MAMTRTVQTVFGLAVVVGTMAGCGSADGFETSESSQELLATGVGNRVSESPPAARAVDKAAAESTTPSVVTNDTLQTARNDAALAALRNRNPTGPQRALPECSVVDNYSASLAEAIIACTGTLGPDSLTVSGDVLRRKFDKCTAANDRQAALRQVDDLLGLQYRKDLEGRECFAKQWQLWRALLLTTSQGVECPVWREVGREGSFDLQMIRDIVSKTSQQTAMQRSTDGTSEGFSDRKIDVGKENIIYSVSFASGLRESRCGSSEQCAEACTGGLPGFFVNKLGSWTAPQPADGSQAMTYDHAVKGDPRAWLTVNNSYADVDNPFKQYGYAHLMSTWRGAPGDLYGNRFRATEACWRWDPYQAMHRKGLLVMDCIPEIPDSCMTICSLDAVATTTTASTSPTD